MKEPFTKMSVSTEDPTTLHSTLHPHVLSLVRSAFGCTYIWQ